MVRVWQAPLGWSTLAEFKLTHYLEIESVGPEGR